MDDDKADLNVSQNEACSNKVKPKISCRTQVEPQLVVYDERNITGQEGTSLSNSLEHVSLKKQNKGIRPPLVGQASSSSSSNNSVVLSSIESKVSDSDNGDKIMAHMQRALTENIDSQHENVYNTINFTRGSIPTSHLLLNRDEYINQQPPEGSSVHTRTLIQVLENDQECPRDQSPSSASSVTSSRPLEWDNGADVGYSRVLNNSAENEPSLSTLERMVLDCGRNLLTRSDPEGTTGTSVQPLISNNIIQRNFKLRRKKDFGFPNAQSTPLDTCLSSDVSPETISGEGVSPITGNYGGNQLQGTVMTEDPRPNVNPSGNTGTDRDKISLFPEIKHSDPSGINPSLAIQELNAKGKTLDTFHNSASNSGNFSSVQKDKIVLDISEDEHIKNSSISKKLSSSLEDVSVVSRIPQENKINLYTLPRSHSQLNINKSYSDSKMTKNEIDGEIPKYNMALHSLVHYNKSASSSSIATVVQGKDMSPKHISVQTVVEAQGSISSQDVHPVYVTSHLNKTPHLTKSVLAQFPKRSNYFNFDPSIDQEDYTQNKKSVAKNNHVDCKIHSHDGVPCTGAHRRVSGKISTKATSADRKRYAQNPDTYCNSDFHIPAESYNQIAIKSRELSAKNKSTVGIADSVESSTKSGEFSNDKKCSVTVEDRVNSFEYLPGDVYENNERLQPVDSHGTSSISIQNQSSNNETPEENFNTWDSSESLSNTLEKDVQRGVQLISDFVKGSCANDTILKRKLIRRVVEKLITKNYNDDINIPVHMSGDIMFRPPNPVNRNVRETSANRSKVPCEFSSRSEKAESTNASSECFIPRATASNAFLPSSIRERSTLKGQDSNISTSDTSKEKSLDKSVEPHPLEANIEVIPNGSTSKGLSDSSRQKERVNSDWSEPATRAELYYERKKTNGSDSSSRRDRITLVDYLNKERENQLFWISSEIQHLNNLKQLLEKQEEIKKGIKNLKQRKELHKLPGKHILKERNRIIEDREPIISAKSHHLHNKDKKRPTLNAWLEKSVTVPKENTGLSPALTTDETEGWNSHHYHRANDENRTSYLKRNNKHDKKGFAGRGNSTGRQERAIYDEPPHYFHRPHNSKQPPPVQRYGHNNQDGSIFITDEGVSKKNAQTETLESVGVQTSDSVSELPVVHPLWFKHKVHPADRDQKESKSREDKRKACNLDKKASVGYFITFDSTSKGNQQLRSDFSKAEEARIPLPAHELKKAPKRHNRNVEPDKFERQDGRIRAGADAGTSVSEDTSSEGGVKEEDCRIRNKKIYQGAPGVLQYYLLRNRPSYVSRAEDRRQCIAQMQYLRELREQNKKRLLSLTKPVVPLLPPPSHHEVKRIFSTEAIRKQTEKKYRQLAEVKRKQEDMKKKESYRTNRLMAEIFTKKLQKKVLKGEVNLSNSVSVISTL